MKAIKLQTEIPPDRTLHLRLPDEVAEGPAAVVVLVSESGSSIQDLLRELPTLTRRLWSREEIAGSLCEDEILTRLVSELRGGLNGRLRRVVLFGSRARGDHRPHSDYDCLVLVDEMSASVEEVIDDVSGALLDRYDAVFSIFPAAEQSFEEEVHNPLFRNVAREGVVLWPRRPEATS